MLILVLNVGSSSLKFQLIGTGEEHFDGNTDQRLARGPTDEELLIARDTYRVVRGIGTRY